MVENKSEFFEPSDAWSEIQGDQVVNDLKKGKTVGQINEEFARLTGLKKSQPEKKKPVKKRRNFQARAVDDLMNLRMGPSWGRNTRG